MGDERDRANAVKHYDDDQPGMFGDELLEVGPGPGLTTDVLRRKAARVTAVELDLALAEKLAASNVRVIAGDVIRLPFPVGRP